MFQTNGIFHKWISNEWTNKRPMTNIKANWKFWHFATSKCPKEKDLWNVHGEIIIFRLWLKWNGWYICTQIWKRSSRIIRRNDGRPKSIAECFFLRCSEFLRDFRTIFGHSLAKLILFLSHSDLFRKCQIHFKNQITYVQHACVWKFNF